jgi:hypothetical protein
VSSTSFAIHSVTVPDALPRDLMKRSYRSARDDRARAAGPTTRGPRSSGIVRPAGVSRSPPITVKLRKLHTPARTPSQRNIVVTNNNNKPRNAGQGQPRPRSACLASRPTCADAGRRRPTYGRRRQGVRTEARRARGRTARSRSNTSDKEKAVIAIPAEGRGARRGHQSSNRSSNAPRQRGGGVFVSCQPERSEGSLLSPWKRQ